MLLQTSLSSAGDVSSGSAAQNIFNDMAAQANNLYTAISNGPSKFSAQTVQYASDVSQLQSIARDSSNTESADANNLLAGLGSLTPDLSTLTTETIGFIPYALPGAIGTYSPGSTVRNIAEDLLAQANAAISILDNASAGGTAGITFQVGATNASTDRLVISLSGATTDGLGVSSSSVGIGSLSSARAAMSAIDIALDSINSFMGNIGSYQNRLQYTIENLATGIENYSSSASAIEDADMASEFNALTKSRILQQSGMAMLAQANSQLKSTSSRSRVDDSFSPPVASLRNRPWGKGQTSTIDKMSRISHSLRAQPVTSAVRGKP